jgi:uracil-DNA glycosylase family 4
MQHTSGPAPDCSSCVRLAGFRTELQLEEPTWFNAPVPSFGDPAALLLIVGLAPGKHGANRTGRPFTGDYAGDLLYQTLADHGLSSGTYESRPDDGLALRSCMITNAVRCLPPQNKPIGAEINNCRPYLMGQIEALSGLRAILALGRIAHESVVRGFGGKLKDHKFVHGAAHDMSNTIVLVDSYHCSRYNTNTGRLTPQMFSEAMATAKTCAGL